VIADGQQYLRIIPNCGFGVTGVGLSGSATRMFALFFLLQRMLARLPNE
jgi:hypothetical protein